MVLMGVREENAGKAGALLLDEADIGQDDIDAGLAVVGKGDAKIDESNAKAWISQGQALLDAAAQLAATP